MTIRDVGMGENPVPVVFEGSMSLFKGIAAYL